MSTDKFIFKIHQNGRVDRVKDCDNITFSDVINGLGISENEIEYKPIRDSGVYAFYADDSDVLIFGVPERKPVQFRQNEMVHGILASQFSILSRPQGALF
jgi:hypothetical protein